LNIDIKDLIKLRECLNKNHGFEELRKCIGEYPDILASLIATSKELKQQLIDLIDIEIQLYDKKQKLAKIQNSLLVEI